MLLLFSAHETGISQFFLYFESHFMCSITALDFE